MQASSKIYVAGHTGLIGSAVVRALASYNFYKVVTRSHEELDLTNKNDVEVFFEKETPHYVILAAGKVGGIIDNQTFPADFISQNLAIQYNVIQAAHRCGTSRLISFASSCMYPRECFQPMAETALLSGKPEPTSLSYAIAKFAGMQMCLAHNQQYKNKNFIPVIPNSVYGPNDNFDPSSSHVLSALIRRLHEAKILGARDVTLWGSGSPRREFIHADDVAAASLSLLETDLSELELPINIGSGSDYSIRELAELISDVVGFEGKINWDTSKPDGAPRKLLDSSRLLSTGWRPNVEFKYGLRSTYDWFLQNHCR
jgi:GDP-L-fucose synthase